MSRKCLIISSSPRRKGNSEILCQQFAKGAMEAGVEVEKINLNDYNIFCVTHNFARNTVL